ncbi:MAG: hypothetical protein HY403_02205 [Elusimicrobia bacterium]|nr:hypothetical protein [Elusimicrobiota bacterium]
MRLGYFPALALILAWSASAQTIVSADQAEGVAAARVAPERYAPAPVDPGPVRALVARLARDGERIEMEEGIGNIYTRMGAADASGRFRNLRVNLVEMPAELAEASRDDLPRQAVMRRSFLRLEATSESWEIDSRTGRGAVHVWIYQVGLEGRLLSVEHQIAPAETGTDGRAVHVEEKVRSYRLAPSDPAARRRWEALAKELLTLGRAIDA